MTRLPNFKIRPAKKKLSIRRRYLGTNSRMRMQISRLYQRVFIVFKLISHNHIGYEHLQRPTMDSWEIGMPEID